MREHIHRFFSFFIAGLIFSLPLYAIEPIREEVLAKDGTRLVMKHFKGGGKPLLLVHGLAQNDRCFDSPYGSYAKWLNTLGYDVWVANLRGYGTPGFRSESGPGNPSRLDATIDVHAMYDMPAFVDRILSATRMKPYFVTHSMGAWVTDRYLELPGSQVAGIVSIAGVYNLWWTHSIYDHALVRNEDEFYGSNYELELLARAMPLDPLLQRIPRIPMEWIRPLVYFPFSKIPWIGGSLDQAYENFKSTLLDSPLFSMIYYPKNVTREVAYAHLRDGIEDMAPQVIRALGATVRNRVRSSENGRKMMALPNGGRSDVPIIFIAGQRDRLANPDMILHDGFEKSVSTQKAWRLINNAGHFDIINGVHSENELFAVTAEWLGRF